MEAHPPSDSEELILTPYRGYLLAQEAVFLGSREVARCLHIVDLRLDVGLSADENGFTLPCKERRVIGEPVSTGRPAKVSMFVDKRGNKSAPPSEDSGHRPVNSPMIWTGSFGSEQLVGGEQRNEFE